MFRAQCFKALGLFILKYEQTFVRTLSGMPGIEGTFPEVWDCKEVKRLL